MKNELISIGPLTIYGYGLMIAVGILAAYGITEYRAKKQNLEHEKIVFLAFWCVAGGFLCAKILYWMTEYRAIKENPQFLLWTLTDGFVVYGGIIGGIFSGYLYSRKQKWCFWKYFDLVMPSIALAQGFGRIGCFLAGCCYGKETQSIWGVTFRDSAFAPNHISLHPTQLYASVLDFLHFLLLLYVAKKKKADGQVAAVYLICYSIGRFLLEFFRGDLERGSVGVLSTSQFISIFILAAGVLLFWMTSGWHKNADRE